jgi:hypothetical protein
MGQEYDERGRDRSPKRIKGRQRMVRDENTEATIFR